MMNSPYYFGPPVLKDPVYQGGEVHDYSQSVKIRARGAPRIVRREAYKGGLYTIFFHYFSFYSGRNYKISYQGA
jgi:hypothetical protein